MKSSTELSILSTSPYIKAIFFAQLSAFFQAHIEKTEGDIKELTESAINLKSNYLELTELRHVLDKTQSFFVEKEEANGLDSVHKALIPEEGGAGGGAHNVSIRGRLGFVAGVINRERVPAFERMLWRISRGNVFLRRAEIEKPLEDPATVRKRWAFCRALEWVRVMVLWGGRGK